MTDWTPLLAVATLALALATFILAAMAYRSVRAANDANRELRVERELSVLPVLSAVAHQTWQSDGTLGLDLRVVNWSAHPALIVSAELLVGPWDGLAPDAPRPSPSEPCA